MKKFINNLQNLKFILLSLGLIVMYAPSAYAEAGSTTIPLFSRPFCVVHDNGVSTKAGFTLNADTTYPRHVYLSSNQADLDLLFSVRPEDTLPECIFKDGVLDPYQIPYTPSTSLQSPSLPNNPAQPTTPVTTSQTPLASKPNAEHVVGTASTVPSQTETSPTTTAVLATTTDVNPQSNNQAVQVKNVASTVASGKKGQSWLALAVAVVVFATGALLFTTRRKLKTITHRQR